MTTPDRDAALAAALTAVSTWRRCTAGLLPHRREPLLHERMLIARGTWVADDDTAAGEAHRVGLDDRGRVRLVGPDRDPEGWGGDDVATVTWTEQDSEVLLHDSVLRYRTDAAGRVVELHVDGEQGSGTERYRYDADGRVVQIDEDEAVAEPFAGQRLYLADAGARLTVEHAGGAPARLVTYDRTVVWERHDEPWPALLRRGAATIARLVVDGVRARVAELSAEGTEVFSLMLVYVGQGSLHIEPASFGLEAERRGWIADGLEEQQLDINRFYPIRDGHGLDWIDPDWDDELDTLLLREAALNDVGGDPYTAVLDEAARQLARHDWDGLVVPTADFVVYCAEHDEGFAPKVRAIAAANPPERAAGWQLPREEIAMLELAAYHPPVPDRVWY